MAIRTQEPNILETVVRVIPIYVIQLKNERLPLPGVDATYLAERPLDAFGNQPLSQPTPTDGRRVLDQELG
jgi:hypothetical protein